MGSDLNKALILCLLFLCIFSVVVVFESVSNLPVLKGDLPAHLDKAKTGNAGIYPPFFSWVSSPFAFYSTNYYFFTIILLLFVFPMIFFWLVKDWRIVLFYFSTGFVYRMDLFGSLPMALGGLFFFVFVLIKDWRIKLLLLLVSPLVHSQLFFLLLGSWMIIELFKLGSLSKFVSFGFFCNYVPIDLEGISPVKSTFGRGISPNTLFDFGGIARFFLMDFSLPLVILSLKGFIEKKRIDLIFVGVFVFIAGFFVYSRAEYMLCLIGIIGCTWGIKKLSRNWVNLIYLICVILIGLNLLHWFLELVGWCL